MAPAVAINQTLAKHHIAPAFAVYDAIGPGCAVHGLLEHAVGRQTPGVKLWITARQNDRVRRWRRFIRKRRKERQFRACVAPIGQDVRIGKSKRLILGHGDALRGRGQAMHGAGWWRQFARDLDQRGQIDARGNTVGHRVDKLIQIRAFPCLHES